MGKMLRIGFNRDFYPLAHGDSGHSSGIVIDIVKQALARTDISAAFVPRSLDNLSRQFADGDIQAFAGIAITADRQRQVVFSTPLIDSGGAWFRLGDCKNPIETAATPSAGPLVSAIESLFPDIRIHEVPDYRTALGKAVAGEVDAAALNIHVGRHQANNYFPGALSLPAKPFSPLQLGMAFELRTDRGFIKAFDGAIEAIRRLGVIDDIVRQYMAPYE